MTILNMYTYVIHVYQHSQPGQGEKAQEHMNPLSSIKRTDLF